MPPEGRALCLVCGRSGPIVGQSLDPGHPLMRCHWSDKDGDHGHGLRIGTLDQAESDVIQVAANERRQLQAHGRGSHDKGVHRYCPACVAATAAKARETARA